MLISNKQQYKILKEAGAKLAFILREVIKKTEVGMSTLELDELAEKLIYKEGGKPSFKGYEQGGGVIFPASLCVSIDDEVVHGIPSKEIILKEEDLLSLDIGMKYKGMFVDMARTIIVGGIDKADELTKKLLKTGERALEIAISEAREGNYMGNIGEAAQNYIELNGFGVVRKLVGHGVGNAVHEEPEVPNFGRRGEGIKLKKGMVLAIEPMITEKDFDVFLDENKWTWKTKDRARAVHFEDTVVVGEKSGEKITQTVRHRVSNKL